MKLLTQKETHTKLGIGRTKFADMVRDKLFPAPKYLPNCTTKLWPEQVVNEWLAQNLLDEPTGKEVEAGQ